VLQAGAMKGAETSRLDGSCQFTVSDGRLLLF